MASEAKAAPGAATVSCLRCGAIYPAGAVVCFKCGAPIGETSIPTQPVAAVHARPPTPEAPEEDPGATQPRLRAAAKPARALRPAPSPAERARRARRRRTIAYVALLGVLVAAVYAGIVLSIRAFIAAPPVSQQTVYQDPQHRFRLKRPTIWTVTPAPDGVLLSDGSGASTLRVSIAPNGDGQSAEARADDLARAQGLGQASTRQIAGQVWQRREGQVTGRDGATREDVIYVTPRDGQFYVIEESSPLATFQSIDTLVYQPALASFAFA